MYTRRKTMDSQHQRLQGGFTLIELLVTVVIVAILAAIAYPSYTRYVVETRRTDGQAGLTQMASRLEKFYTQCGSYNNANTIVSGAGSFQGCTGLELGHAFSSERNYTMNIVLGPFGATGAAIGYTINAVPVGSQATRDTDCQTLTLTSAGVKGQTGPNTEGRCWRR
jgi:type IV pilus assembly protein PilE